MNRFGNILSSLIRKDENFDICINIKRPTKNNNISIPGGKSSIYKSNKSIRLEDK